MSYIYNKAKSVLILISGIALTAFSMGSIIIPMNFAAGGVTGFSKVACQALPISLSLMVLIINLLLLILGLIFIGKKFVIKTIAVSILFPVFLEFFSALSLSSIYSDALICVIVAGVSLGVGAGLIIRSGASSGGFDIIAVILNKKYSISLSVVLNIIDAFVILIQAVNVPIVNTIYGIIVITISATIVGKVVTLGAGEAQIMIFSEYNAEIRSQLIENVDVGLTVFKTETGLKQNDLDVIVTIVPYSKVSLIKQTISEIDPVAFVVVSQVQSVIGKGYTLDRQFKSPVLSTNQ